LIERLPHPFLMQMKQLLPLEAYESFLLAMEEMPSTSVRLNLKRELKLDFETSIQVPWEQSAFYLKERPLFTTDPLFHAGAYYVQEASSMLLKLVAETYLSSGQPLVGIDLCAAPGGKTTHLFDLMSDDSLLVANEVVPARFQVLNENLIRWGRHNMIRSLAPVDKIAGIGPVFDFVLVDAPCSGEGMMRKDEQAISHWSLSNVVSCAERQKAILESAVKMLKPRGILIYSTCTFNMIENEDIGDWLIDEHEFVSLAIPGACAFGFEERSGIETQAYVAYPHRVKGEGFCLQVFRKVEKEIHSSRKLQLPKTILHDANSSVIAPWIIGHETLKIMEQSGEYYMVDERHLDFFLKLQLIVKGVIPGRRLGALKGKNLVPDHELALSILPLNQDIPTISLTREEAIQYLKGEVPPFDDNYAKGWNLVTYQGAGLGWVKVLDMRINNYYPASYRIRMR